jgi:hypothetical protein
MSQVVTHDTARVPQVFRVFRGMTPHRAPMPQFATQPTMIRGEICRMKRDQPPGDTPSRFVPSEHWIENFDTQCTKLLLKRARRYAAQRAQDLGWEMPGAGAYDPDELVDNILRDTLAGVLRWDPERRGFARHLYDAVRSRVDRYAKRMAPYPHESVDAVDSAGRSHVMAEIEAQLLADAPEATFDTSLRVDETMHSLQRLARRKPLVRRLLAAFELRVTEKEDVMHLMHLTDAEYDNARRQLARLVALLPRHLKPRVAKGA